MANCNCEHNRDGNSLFAKRKSTDKVLCLATNQQQVPRPIFACLHLLRLSRLNGMTIMHDKRRR